MGADAATAYVTDADREDARRLRHDHFFAEPDLAERIYMPIRFLWRALEAFGYERDPDCGFLAPDGSPSGDMVEAMQVEIIAAALANERGSRPPASQALDQIREVAAIPVGQILLPPEERIRALTAKVERIGNIAADRAPDEDWRPALIEEAGAPHERLAGPPSSDRGTCATRALQLLRER
ncbi:MAG: hypothetical protein JSS97_21120 [Actinobacteria bacterium]|nr:hypothetical protein [Actinomycetota bacterium]